jgi:hypothetical protein
VILFIPRVTLTGAGCFLRAVTLAALLAAVVSLGLTGEPPQPRRLAHRHGLAVPLDGLA